MGIAATGFSLFLPETLQFVQRDFLIWDNPVFKRSVARLFQLLSKSANSGLYFHAKLKANDDKKERESESENGLGAIQPLSPLPFGHCLPDVPL